jgi:protein phosphatase
LIAAANEAGGRDNITVILFRLDEVGGPDGAADPGATIEYATAPSDDSTRTGTMEVPATKPRAQLIEEPPARTAPPPKRRRRRRVPAAAIVVVAFIALVLAGLWTASRAVYFVGVDSATGIVTVYRGLPYELPLGLDLYESDYRSGVRIQQVPAARRATFTNHKLRSRDDAKGLVIDLERGNLQ